MAKQIVSRLLRAQRAAVPQIVSPLLYASDKLEEQRLPSYKPEKYYPVSLGQVFKDKYRVVGKLGYGSHSTVWLAEDIQRWRWQARRCSVLKILTNDYVASDSAVNTELKVSDCIMRADPKHEGLRYLRTLIDSFELSGPDGKHFALVYEPMRETISTFQRRAPDNRFPGYFLKAILHIVLKGLDYLHTKCCIIHTDLKPDNILLGFESQDVIEEFLRDEANNPSPRIAEGDRFIYLTRDFGGIQGVPREPKIADFGLAVWGNVPQPHNHPIQPNLFQAPEVILRSGWTYSADIWNFGVMILDLLENRTLFDATDPSTGQYKPHLHLAEMVSLLGLPPPTLVQRGEEAASYFTPEGELLCNETGSRSPTSFETCVTTLTGEDKMLFIEFLKKMLRWIPEERATAADLLQDAWLNKDL